MDFLISSKVSEVVVYPDRARLTAMAELDLDGGNHKIIVDELPLVIIPESVRVSGQGTAQVQIGSVDVRRSFYERTPVENVREIEDKIQELNDERKVLADEESIFQAQGEYLEGLRRATLEYAKGIARGKTNIEDYARLSEYLQENDRSLRASIRKLDNEMRDLDVSLEKLNRELNELYAGRSKQGFQVVVDVAAEAAGKFTLQIIYLIRKSAWRPLYDMRLTDNEDGKKLDITVLAEIKQNSGSEWRSVQMSVSTARPALSQRAPELKPWYIDESRSMPAPQLQAKSSHVLTGASSLADMPAPAVDSNQVEGPPPVVAAAQVARQDTSGSATTFHVTGRSDIPGDGTPHKTTIAQYAISPTIDYLVVPKQVDAIYRRVKIVNTTDTPLLAGKVNLFSASEYIGSVDIDYTAPGDELELLFGTEDRITVERELTQREVEKTRLRDRRELKYGYEVKLRNLFEEEVSVEVQDHIPVSRHEEIKVGLERAVPEPTEQSDLNLLKWTIAIPPEEEKSIQYEYVVSYPRQMRVIGLVD